LLLSDEHDPVNLGNPNEITVIEFAKIINQLTENPSGFVYKEQMRGESDPQRRQPDISRAKRILGWEPKISLETGLLRTIPYFRHELDLA